LQIGSSHKQLSSHLLNTFTKGNKTQEAEFLIIPLANNCYNLSSLRTVSSTAASYTAVLLTGYNVHLGFQSVCLQQQNAI